MHSKSQSFLNPFYCFRYSYTKTTTLHCHLFYLNLAGCLSKKKYFAIFFIRLACHLHCKASKMFHWEPVHQIVSYRCFIFHSSFFYIVKCRTVCQCVNCLRKLNHDNVSREKAICQVVCGDLA